jgi:hypothetical protein
LILYSALSRGGDVLDDYTFKLFVFGNSKLFCVTIRWLRRIDGGHLCGSKILAFSLVPFLRESLLALGRDYQPLLRRGISLPALPSLPAAAPQPSRPMVSYLAVYLSKLSRQARYSESKLSPMKVVVDSLASDSAMAKSLETGVKAAKIPKIVRCVVEAEVIPATVTSIPSSTTLSLGLVTWTRSRVEKAVGGILGRVVPPRLEIAMGRVISLRGSV